MYVFTFSDGREWTTGSPAVSTVFNQSGTMYVNVTATNLGKQIRMVVAILFGTIQVHVTHYTIQCMIFGSKYFCIAHSQEFILKKTCKKSF